MTETLTNPWEKLGIMPVALSAVPSMLDVVWGMKKRLAVCLVGETGIGKTPIVHQWAASKNGYVQVLPFGQMTEEQIALAMFNEDGSAYDFVQARWFIDVNEQAEKTGCAVLFMDEWNRGSKALVNALFGLTDDRTLHGRALHPNVIVVAAMNPSSGAYLVNEAERDHAIRKRLNFAYVTHDLLGWVQHARKSSFHPDVIDFVSAAAPFFYDQGARDAGKCFPCPSNWEKVSQVITSAEQLLGNPACYENPAVGALLSGQIGSVASDKFLEFAKNREVLVEPKDVLEAYHDKARGRVLRLLNATLDDTGKVTHRLTGHVRSDVIAVLNESIANILINDQPSPESEVPGNFARYCCDLGDETYNAYAHGCFHEIGQKLTPAGQAWLSTFTRAMRIAVPEYQKMVNRTIAANARAAKEKPATA